MASKKKETPLVITPYKRILARLVERGEMQLSDMDESLRADIERIMQAGDAT